MNFQIDASVKDILNRLPAHVQLVAAAKTRSVDQVTAAIAAGIKIIGYNYVQEAESMYRQIGRAVKWHMIGHLQRNKVKKVISFVDMIETIDTLRLGETVDRLCAEINKTMSVLIEVNSGREAAKAGVVPEEVPDLVQALSRLKNLRVEGLMTMGPAGKTAEESRPYFRKTKELYDTLSQMKIPNVQMRCLSMGMSDSYQVAIEEGATIVRIGTALFGPRGT